MAAVTTSMIKELRERTGVGMGKCKEALEEANGDMELAIANLRKSGMASAVKKEGRETKEGLIAFAETPSAIAIVEVNAETDFVVRNDRFKEFLTNVAHEAALTLPPSLDAFLNQKYSKEPELTVDQYRATIVQTIGENIQIKRLLIIPKKSDRSIGVYSHLGGKIITVVELLGSGDQVPLAKDIAMHVAAAAPEYLTPKEVPQAVIDNERDIASSQVQGKATDIVNKIVEGKVNAYFDTNCLSRQKYIRDDSLTITDLVNKHAKESGKALSLASFIRWSVGQ